MATIERFEEIISWQEARKLSRELGELIDNDRFKHSYKLIDQIERSAGSIMDNIAEGFERNGNKEFIQFLYIAKGSTGELRSQLYRAIDRKYLTEAEFEKYFSHSKRISALIQKLIVYLSNSNSKGLKYDLKTK